MYYNTTVHVFKNIKNESHDTIHTFKNYFAIVFSVFSFSNNKFNPNRQRKENQKKRQKWPISNGIKTGGTNKIKAKKKKKQLEYETNVGLVGAVYCKYGLDKKIKLYQLVQLLLKQNFY